MDLTPLSFHASLEEQWDDGEKTEEIKSVLKVVPPAYHKYLDVFSKMKAEKLPPHCTCDHHIELESLLPPSGSNTQRNFQPCPYPSLPTIVETDASDYSLGAVLSHMNDSQKNSIAFDSYKLLPAELNYELMTRNYLA
ncbi:hypothetical protein O181_009761 [Austropuccinia psidii MF-1]|uniref:Reverse transcriptase/retrotransposon-derived protein RNase H-like domain-containing protein n=1 Tax=Austropuccinia psidii MF-1 TaxID=1389203 RepID=A0A9Q3BSG5_9BASI|nr:hypothetical protein [Austropuccinia psidii MF-1]